MFHSSLVRDASLRSIGYLNQVSINFFFLMKTYLELWPTRCTVAFCTLIFLIGSWCLRACDYTSQGEHLPLSDAMWLFVITFTTVGMFVCEENFDRNINLYIIFQVTEIFIHLQIVDDVSEI
jgi:hypothetical protein